MERGPEPHNTGSSQQTLASLDLGQRVQPPILNDQTKKLWAFVTAYIPCLQLRIHQADVG